MNIDPRFQSECASSVRAMAKAFNLDEDLVEAIAWIESSMNPMATRYEKDFNYIFNASIFAHDLGISTETEVQLQKFSFGLMQVLGCVARELGYQGPMMNLCSVITGSEYGCKKLVKISEKHPDEDDMISAYNQGSPIKSADGKYRNQAYVDLVKKKLALLRR